MGLKRAVVATHVRRQTSFHCRQTGTHSQSRVVQTIKYTAHFILGTRASNMLRCMQGYRRLHGRGGLRAQIGRPPAQQMASQCPSYRLHNKISCQLYFRDLAHKPEHLCKIKRMKCKSSTLSTWSSHSTRPFFSSVWNMSCIMSRFFCAWMAERAPATCSAASSSSALSVPLATSSTTALSVKNSASYSMLRLGKKARLN